MHEPRVITLYGIRNCDTVKRARGWLDANGIAYAFHDYKKAGVDPDRLRGWVGDIGWTRMLNRSGTTFRKLPDAERHVDDADAAITVMLAHPSTIRRPVLETGGNLLVGFDQERYRAALAATASAE